MSLARVAEFCARNRMWIGLGALAVILAFAAGFYVQQRKQRVATEASWDLYQATQLESESEKLEALREVSVEYKGAMAARIASFEIANTLYRRGRYQEALESFQRFLKSNPRHLLAPAAMEAIGYCHESLGQWNEAVETYEALIKKWSVSPQAERAPYRLGICYENLGRKEKAIEAYKRTMELQPGTLWAENAEERLARLSPRETGPSEEPPGVPHR